MILLTSADSLQILLAGAITTNQAVLFASYLDVATDASTAAPGNSSGSTNNTTAVNWIAAPSSGLVRQAKYLSCYNADTATITATVRVNDGVNTRIIGKFQMLTGERLAYVDGHGFTIYSATGAAKAVATSLADGDYGDIVVTGGVVALDTTAGTGKHAVWVAAGSMSPSAAGGCAALATIASASNQPDIQSLDFDPTTQEYAQFSLKMPSSWNEGTITFRPVWSHPSTTTNFGVVWDLQAVAVSDDDAIAVAFGTAQTSTDTGGTTNDVYVGPESSAITVSGSPAAGDTVFFRLSRVTGNGSDTMGVDARMHGIEVMLTTNERTDS